MVWPFRANKLLHTDTANWHLENFEWLVRNFNENNAFGDAELVLPAPGFFPTDGEKGRELAERIFARVKEYCGMSEWEVKLVPDDNPLAKSQSLAVGMVQPQKHALGTFGFDGEVIEITYAADLVERPDRLISTFAHELAHYLLVTAKEEPPCDREEHEFLTDLTATFLGFGVFIANSRFEYQQFQDGAMQGWQMGRSGYLPEADIIFDLALFLRSKKVDPEIAKKHLKAHLAKLLDRGIAQVDASPELKVLQDLVANGSSANEESGSE